MRDQNGGGGGGHEYSRPARNSVPGPYLSPLIRRQEENQWIEPDEIDWSPWGEARGQGARAGSERQKRVDQIMAIAREVEPATSRGVAYVALARRLIRSKKQFEAVAELVRNLRDRGTMPFEWITDQGRPMWIPERFGGAFNYLSQTHQGFYLNLWEAAAQQVFICVEKAALHGVFEPVAMEYDAPIVSTEGFNSLTRLHDIAQHLRRDKRSVLILNLGDHDPAGVAIMLKNAIKLEEYSGRAISTVRVAALPEHIRQFNLLTRRAYDKESPFDPGKHIPFIEGEGRGVLVENRMRAWDFRRGVFDLDAINPNDARALLRAHLEAMLPEHARRNKEIRERREQAKLAKLIRYQTEVERFLRTLP